MVLCAYLTSVTISDSREVKQPDVIGPGSKTARSEFEFFLTKRRKKIIYICPTSGERLIRKYTKFDFITVDEEKERLNASRDKNQGKHRRKKAEKSCATFLLCDPGLYAHKSDVQNKWDDNTHTRTQVRFVQVERVCPLCRV